jgi:hypothetical protein
MKASLKLRPTADVVVPLTKSIMPRKHGSARYRQLDPGKGWGLNYEDWLCESASVSSPQSNDCARAETMHYLLAFPILMPRVTTGNTTAPCVIIGERAAEVIWTDHKL